MNTKHKILILNGPNLNLLGKREPTIYGAQDFESYFEEIKEKYAEIAELYYYQSNIEGEMINKIHEIGFEFDGIVLNAGAYTHTSVAIADALSAVTTPCIEVHISNVHKREAFRHKSYLSANCVGVMAGFGLYGYQMAVDFLLQHK